MELQDLCGTHILSGIEFGVTKTNHYWGYEDANYVKFTLDGTTYIAVEDPDDGYRSWMKELTISEEKCKVELPAIKVICSMRADDRYENHDVLELRDSLTGGLILAVGTGNYDDWYPYAVCEYHPENMCVNLGKEG